MQKLKNRNYQYLACHMKQSKKWKGKAYTGNCLLACAITTAVHFEIATTEIIRKFHFSVLWKIFKPEIKAKISVL